MFGAACVCVYGACVCVCVRDGRGLGIQGEEGLGVEVTRSTVVNYACFWGCPRVDKLFVHVFL